MGDDAAVDTAAAEAAFAASRDGTVGVEEEFMLLDPDSLDLVPRFEELRDAAAEGLDRPGVPFLAADPVLAESVAGELIRSEIEIRSGAGEDLRDALRRQADHRRRLFALADGAGVALGATGTHPFADHREQAFIQTPHYRRVVDGLQYVARRNNTFSLHVHVGVQGADRAIAACDRLRGALPALLAHSANSPFLEGGDTGLHTARTQTFTKSFPRCGVPDHFGSWRAFADYVDLLVRTRSIVEYTQVWWSIRPHFSFGTVEVRICDAQSTAAESDALAALLTGCVLQAARDHDEGVPFEPPPPRMVEENLWRAIRHGRDGRLIDLGRLVEEDADAQVERLLAWSAPARAEHDVPEPELDARGGARRQRDRLGRGGDVRTPPDPDELRAAFAASVEETRSYATQEAPA